MIVKYPILIFCFARKFEGTRSKVLGEHITTKPAPHPFPSHQLRAHAPCSLIPTARHFCRRQYGHLFRVFAVTRQFLAPLHAYWLLTRTLRLKKLLHASQERTPKWFPLAWLPQTLHSCVVFASSLETVVEKELTPSPAMMLTQRAPKCLCVKIPIGLPVT